MRCTKYLLVILPLMLIFSSCNNDSKSTEGSALDVGRTFIRATLDGDFKTAKTFVLNEADNIGMFDSYRRMFERLPPDTRRSYKNASYTINSYRALNDSVSLINYSNSFMKGPTNIKMMKTEAAWKVNLLVSAEDTISK